MVQSLDRGIQILMILAERSSASITELAEALDVDKSTASRLAETLRQRDMVRVDPETKRFRLGFRILHLGEALKDNLNVIAIARPMLLALSLHQHADGPGCLSGQRSEIPGHAGHARYGAGQQRHAAL